MTDTPKRNGVLSVIANKCEYDFSRVGIQKLYSDTLDAVFSALDGENKDYTIEELNINITIGDKQISVPMYADSFEGLFDFLTEAHNDICEGVER